MQAIHNELWWKIQLRRNETNQRLKLISLRPFVVRCSFSCSTAFRQKSWETYIVNRGIINSCYGKRPERRSSSNLIFTGSNSNSKRSRVASGPIFDASNIVDERKKIPRNYCFMSREIKHKQSLKNNSRRVERKKHRTKTEMKKCSRPKPCFSFASLGL